MDQCSGTGTHGEASWERRILWLGPTCEAPTGLPLTCPCPVPPGLARCTCLHLRCSTAHPDPVPLPQSALPSSSSPSLSPLLPSTPSETSDLYLLHCFLIAPHSSHHYFVTHHYPGRTPYRPTKCGRWSAPGLRMPYLDSFPLCPSLIPTKTSVSSPLPGGTLGPKATLL